MSKNQKYSAGQRKAYYSGQGYRAGYEGKAIPFKNPKNKQSFREGFASVKITVSKYPDLESKKKR